MWPRPITVAAVGLAAVASAALGLAVLAWRTELPVESGAAAAAFDPAAVARGAELAQIGNCNACHMRAGGAAYAGGRPIETPFGVLFSANITPHLQTGIGGWSRAAFARAMREGVDRRGRHRYPAFPYDHFTKLNDADIDALYAFVMTRAPVAATTPHNQLMLPFRFRPLLAVWKALFLDRTPPPSDPSKGEDWNRGAYLVEALAHCGACHTPHNLLGATKHNEPFAGGQAESWRAPPLNARSPAPLPLQRDDIVAYLQRGYSSSHGLALGPMAEVSRSLAMVPASDVRAIATYVASFSGRPDSAERIDAKGVIAADERRRQALAASTAGPPRKGGSADIGAALYGSACARCHEPRASTAAAAPTPPQPLALSTALHMSTPDNLVNIVLDGIEAREGGGKLLMPHFRDTFDAQQTKLLAAYLRRAFTGREAWTNLDGVVNQAYRRRRLRNPR